MLTVRFSAEPYVLRTCEVRSTFTEEKSFYLQLVAYEASHSLDTARKEFFHAL